MVVQFGWRDVLTSTVAVSEWQRQDKYHPKMWLVDGAQYVLGLVSLGVGVEGVAGAGLGTMLYPLAKVIGHSFHSGVLAG